MTKQRTFKRRVRTRMAKTGESYAAARRLLVTEPEQPEQPEQPEPKQPEQPEQPQESAAAKRATGRSNPEWFALLDDWGAAERTHAEIARWLAEQEGVSGWWAQMLTVAYEQARGRRLPHERP